MPGRWLKHGTRYGGEPREDAVEVKTMRVESTAAVLVGDIASTVYAYARYTFRFPVKKGFESFKRDFCLLILHVTTVLSRTRATNTRFERHELTDLPRANIKYCLIRIVRETHATKTYAYIINRVSRRGLPPEIMKKFKFSFFIRITRTINISNFKKIQTKIYILILVFTGVRMSYRASYDGNGSTILYCYDCLGIL